MISTGIVRSIDSLGRVVLPKELRTTYDITPDTPLEIFTDGDSIIMRKYHAQGSCVFCGDISPDAVRYWATYIDGKKVREIDPLNFICLIDGTDYLADVRKALGK